MSEPSTQNISLRRRGNSRQDVVAAQAEMEIPPSSSEQSRQGELQFVNVTDRAKLDQPARTQVRTQVMLDFHRRRRQGVEAPLTGHGTEKGTQKERQGQTNKMKLGPTGLQQWKPRKRAKAKESVKIPVRLSNENVVDTSPDSIAPIGEFQETGQDQIQGVQSSERTSASQISTNEQPSVEDNETQWLIRLNESSGSVALPQTVSAGLIDPFSVVSLLIKPRTQLLLYYYFNERIRSSWLMMPIRKGLLSLAIHDDAVFHACLSQYAASYNLRFQTGDPVESIQHRIEGIRILNDRLGDPIKGLSDGSIAAVANIAIYESANGSLSSVEVHLSGLEQMVKMRGGIQEGGFAFFVQRLIAWCDLHCANALSQPPRFPPLDIPIHSRSSNSQTSSNAPTITNSPPNPEPPASIDTILHTLHLLSTTLKYVTPDQPEDIWYSDQVYAVQRRLFDLSYADLPLNISDTMPVLEKSTATAALIFSYAALRDIPFNFRVIATMVKNLHSALELLFSTAETRRSLLCNETCLESKPQRTFWALALGGMASVGRPEHEWFCEKFARICQGLGLNSWKEVKIGLEGVLWTEELDDAGKGLWAEVDTSVTS